MRWYQAWWEGKIRGILAGIVTAIALSPLLVLLYEIDAITDLEAFFYHSLYYAAGGAFAAAFFGAFLGSSLGLFIFWQKLYGYETLVSCCVGGLIGLLGLTLGTEDFFSPLVGMIMGGLFGGLNGRFLEKKFTQMTQ